MDALDAIIIALLALFAYSGFRRGFSWVGPSLIGLLAGLLIGSVAAPPIARALTHDRSAQPLIAIGFFLAIALIIQGIGTGLGFQARVRALRSRFARMDSALGSGLSAIGVIIGAWYLGLVFSQSPWVALDQQIQGSAIERVLDGAFPRPPSFLANLQNILRATDFPNPFASIVQPPPAPVQIPALVNTPGIRTAAANTVKVVALGCGGGAEAGSAWPAATDYLVTNAHVVAGSTTVDIDAPSGATGHATVVLFDPNVDVAILHVTGMGLAALPMAGGDPSRGTSGAVIGYPGGGDESVVAAGVSGTEMARGYNIYGDTLVTRDIEVLAAHVIPGNSGGPMVDQNGVVQGLVFAASTTDPNTGYSLTMSQISSDVNSGVGRSQATSTESCTS
ncbi:MAG: MarP family serine protease [Candidatus Dormibacteraeota bacterium]|nr:MarP family serine protease [Candidatus Dormibacteraeota bacterium]